MKKILFIFITFVSFIYADKIIIGKYEYVTFNDFHLTELQAKIDTGAKTSSLHCSMIEPVGENKVKFILLDSNHEKFQSQIHTAEISRTAQVKSSNGTVQKRYFINTTITFLGKEYFTEFSLSNRGNMQFPVLIGRNLLKKNFLVDVSQEYIGKLNR